MSQFLELENNQKPEWFELAQNDQPVSRPLKKKSAQMRSLTFILAGILVIATGVGFALLTHEDHSAVAVETLNLTQDSPATKAPAAITPPRSSSAFNDIILPPTKKAGEDEEED